MEPVKLNIIMKKYSIILISIILFTSCASVQVAKIERTDKKIELFVTKIPEKPYTEIGYVEVSGSIFHTKEALLKKLIKQAEKEGANGVISIKFNYQFWYPNMEGVLIKFQ